jgi:hypothetical protein
MIKDLINSIISEKVAELVEGKVSFYWEHEANSLPVVEVFIHGSESEVKKNRVIVEKKIRMKGINKAQATVDLENYGHNYHRIMIYMNFDFMNENDLNTIVNELKHYGSSVWEDVY